MEQTESRAVLVSTRTKPVLKGKVDGIVRVSTVKPYTFYIKSLEAGEIDDVQLEDERIRRRSSGGRDAIILHSSGTIFASVHLKFLISIRSSRTILCSYVGLKQLYQRNCNK